MQARTLFGPLVALIMGAASTSADAQIPQAERNALLSLYGSTGGSNWINHSGWNGAAGTECAWFGIECDINAAHVIGIALDDNNLSGTLPSITALTALTYIEVPGNKLTGPIPALSSLTALVSFNVYDNQLSGAIPTLDGLVNLQQVYFSQNQLNGPLPQLSGLTSLTNFDASYNQLSGTIPPLTGLVNLQEFFVAINQLTGTIPSFNGLTNLTSVGVDDNQLTGSIPPLAALANLQGFTASGNKLTGSIPSLTGLVNLQDFYVDSNQLSGSVPSLTGLIQLQQFSVAENSLTGGMPSLAGLANLTYFNVYYNHLTGPISSLNGLGNLQLLYLGFNQFSGSIPALTGLNNLQEVILDDNQLTGSIPPLAGLTNLQTFNAGNNLLSGSIPVLTGLSNLSYFSVSMNTLTGTLPILAGLGNLAAFDASYNQLTGSIPSLVTLGKLQYFYLGFNQLSGAIPSLTGLFNLQDFAVDDNNLSGSLPSLTGLINLQNYLVASNQLTGTIPPITGLGNLQNFQVGNNRLSGSIPALPSPNNLSSGLSSLCPNVLNPTPDAGWDDATGLTPWYSTCTLAESKTDTDAPTTKDSTHIALSSDGTLKVFQSQQTDLTSDTSNDGGQDIYSVGPDGQTVLESVDASGNKLIGTAGLPAISPGGNVVAFLFTAAAAKNAKDLLTGQMYAGPRGQPKHQVDMGMGNVPPNGAANGVPSLSSAGGTNQLVFCSSASNLVPGDGNGARDVFLVDPLNSTIAAQRVSVDSNGSEIVGDSCEPKLSSDGSKVAFSVAAPSLYGTGARQIVRKDLSGLAKALLTGQMLPLTTSSTGQGATSDSSEPTINQDGSVVAFTSQADLDGLGTPSGGMEVYASLAQTSDGTAPRMLKRLRPGDGTVPNGASEHAQISDDGTTVVIQTDATNMLGSTPNQCGAVALTTNFFTPSTLGSTLCTNDGATVNQNPSISGDGTSTGFDSNAPQSNGDTNRNAYSQGAGVYTGLTGVGVPNLSGDFSGQWLDPSQSGQGLVIDVTNPDVNNSRLMLLTWFVFSNGQPTWVQGVGVPHAGTGSAGNTVVVQMDQVAIFKGTAFPRGSVPTIASLWGSITLSFSDANTGQMSWKTSYSGFTSGSMPIKHFLAVALPAQDQASEPIKACYSGNWSNPAQSGHGFEFEILPTSPPLLAVDWFAFSPTGAPVWLSGVGTFSGNSTQMQLYIINGVGAQFPPNFDSGQINQNVWGTATFTFTDSTHASVSWNSTYPGYDSGSQPLQPFADGFLDRRACH